ncbi:MAG: sugar transferase [Candidatus Omnitrophica bacterium]|nr:sugar transferase [Candidatus Omnitrophota bacterium]
MIKERIRLFKRLMAVFDLVVLSIAFVLVYYVRDPFIDVYSLKEYLSFLPAFLIVWAIILQTLGVYESFRTYGWSDFIILIMRSAFLGFLGLSAAVYLLKIPYITPSFLSSIFVFGACFLILEKIFVLNIFRFFRRKGFNYRVLLIVGTGKRAERFARIVQQNKEWGLRIHGFIDEEHNRKGQYIAGIKVIGTFEDFEHIIHNNVIDQVVFIVPRSWLAKIEPLVNLAEIEGIRVSFAIDFFNFKISHARQTDVFGFPLITFESTPDDKFWQLIFKRLIDVVVSGLLLVILAPIFLIIAIIIKATSEGPVFFRQKRVGLNNRIFTMYKFRTMVKDAEEKQGALKLMNKMKGPAFKVINDPRLTPIGRFLRKHSLDELPQLWNVFVGQMSLVGPRPPLPQEVKEYLPWQRRRLSMRPGMTCIWQTSGRNNIVDFDEWMRMDLEYIDNWSLWLDFKLLLKTIPAVILGTGAH